MVVAVNGMQKRGVHDTLMFPLSPVYMLEVQNVLDDARDSYSLILLSIIWLQLCCQALVGVIQNMLHRGGTTSSCHPHTRSTLY